MSFQTQQSGERAKFPIYHLYHLPILLSDINTYTEKILAQKYLYEAITIILFPERLMSRASET